MIEEDPDLYMRGLHYVLTCLYNNGDYSQFMEYLNQFEEFEKKYSPSLNATSNLLAFVYIDTARINKHFLEGSFADGIKLIPELLKRLNKFKMRKSKFLPDRTIVIFE